MNSVFNDIGTYLFSIFPATTPGKVLFVFAHLILLYIVIEALRMLFLLLINKLLAAKSQPFRPTTPRNKKILIVGDSTAVGTGASDPQFSIAGRLAHDFPNVEIRNAGEDGARTKDVATQLAENQHDHFNVIIISTGGNDVWHFTRLKKLRETLAKSLELAKAMSNHRVILLLYNNYGSAPVFPSFIQFFLRRRSVKVQKVFTSVAAEHQVPCIELFVEEKENPFLKHPKRFFAKDGIHPSDDGYRIWYNRMWLTMVRSGFLLSGVLKDS